MDEDGDLFSMLVALLRNQLAILRAVKPQPGIAHLDAGQEQVDRIRETEELLRRLSRLSP